MPDPAKQVPQNLQDALTNLGAAAGKAATTITNLKGQISTGMTQQDVDNVVGQLGTIADGLNTVSSQTASAARR